MKYLFLPERKNTFYSYCVCGGHCGGNCGGNCSANCGNKCGGQCGRNNGGGGGGGIVPIYAYGGGCNLWNV